MLRALALALLLCGMAEPLHRTNKTRKCNVMRQRDAETPIYIQAVYL